jgi:hypothetical protein
VTSSIPAVKAALVTVLTAALPNTQVIYGPLASVTTTTGRTLTVGAVAGRRDLDSMSLDTAVEQYTVELNCYADLPGYDQQLADEQALADYATAEQAIREYAAGPTLGVSGVVHILPLGDFALDEIADDTGRHARVRWSVSVYAQTS